MAKKTTAPSPKKEPHWLNKKQMAASCNISTQAFDKWGVQPVSRIGRESFYTVSDVLLNREQKLLDQMGGHNNPEGDQEFIDKDFEYARKLRADADAQEMKNAVTRRELAPVDLLEWALASIAEQINSILDSIPLKLKKRVPHLKAAELEIAKREIIKAQNAASKSQLPWDQLEAGDK